MDMNLSTMTPTLKLMMNLKEQGLNQECGIDLPKWALLQ